MKRALKWLGLIVSVLLVGAFLAFLYYIPPFFITPPATFTRDMETFAPAVDDITDPKLRTIAGHGREIVVRTGCIGCHAMNGSQGPDLTRYGAGGGLKATSRWGTFVSRNLTPDPETGLARRSDEEVLRILRSGVFPDGHVAPSSVMPWANFSNWTEEDRYAVLIYLRHLKPVRHQIPEADRTPAPPSTPGAIQMMYGAKEYGVPAK